MKIISSKYTECQTVKVLYKKEDNYHEDMKLKRKDGWHPTTRPNWYNCENDIVMKHSSDGIVITYVRYLPFRY